MDFEKLTYNKVITIISTFSNLVFLLIHIAYTIIFAIFGAYIMVYINASSVVLYLFSFLLIRYKKYGIYVAVCGIEIPACMIASTIICGYSCGFQLTLIGLCVLAFVSSYFLKDRGRVLNPLYVSAYFAAAYVFLYFFCRSVDSYYHLPIKLYEALFISHSIIVFVFVVGFMYALVKYVFLLERKIRKESNTDNLTQIANRNALNTYFEGLGDLKSNYVVAIFDIDNFKKFNDVNGHLCGDYILREIARIAKENSLNDFVSRWGGEEFVVISKIEISLDETYNKIDMIRQKIENNKFVYNNKKLHSTITIGVAKYDNDESIEDWIKRADENLYHGKKNGKNQIVFN